MYTSSVKNHLQSSQCRGEKRRFQCLDFPRGPTSTKLGVWEEPIQIFTNYTPSFNRLDFCKTLVRIRRVFLFVCSFYVRIIQGPKWNLCPISRTAEYSTSFQTEPNSGPSALIICYQLSCAEMCVCVCVVWARISCWAGIFSVAICISNC